MSVLNITLGYFITVLSVCGLARVLVSRCSLRWNFLAEFLASFTLAACRLEVQTISEIGQWAGGLGQDITLTMLFLAIVTHRIIMHGVSGNPSVTLMAYLGKETGPTSASLGIAGQFGGAKLALLVVGYYWAMELTDMHMIKNMMMSECSTALRASVLQGVITEAVCALIFHLAELCLRSRSQLLQIPLLGLLLTLLYYAGNNYTSAYVNPALAYAMTFSCPGHRFWEYALVYWLAPITGMTLALLLYMGNIPLLFTKNLLFSKKSRFRLPKVKPSEEKKHP